jgi:hypothetical protein
MTIKSIDRTRDEGLRISFDAKMDKMKIPFKVDITTDDKITPKEVRSKFHYCWKIEKSRFGAIT